MIIGCPKSCNSNNPNMMAVSSYPLSLVHPKELRKEFDDSESDYNDYEDEDEEGERKRGGKAKAKKQPKKKRVATPTSSFYEEPEQEQEQEEEAFNGTFEYIVDVRIREMFSNAWNAITLCNMWDYMSRPIRSYMLETGPEIKAISQKMEDLGYSMHSGGTFGWIMRQMQYIAQHGERKFRDTIPTKSRIII